MKYVYMILLGVGTGALSTYLGYDVADWRRWVISLPIITLGCFFLHKGK